MLRDAVSQNLEQFVLRVLVREVGDENWALIDLDKFGRGLDLGLIVGDKYLNLPHFVMD